MAEIQFIDLFDGFVLYFDEKSYSLKILSKMSCFFNIEML